MSFGSNVARGEDGGLQNSCIIRYALVLVLVPSPKPTSTLVPEDSQLRSRSQVGIRQLDSFPERCTTFFRADFWYSTAQCGWELVEKGGGT